MLNFRWKCYYESEQEDYISYHRNMFNQTFQMQPKLNFRHTFKITPVSVSSSNTLKNIIFTWENKGTYVVYENLSHYYHSMPETLEHKNIRCRNSSIEDSEPLIDVVNYNTPARVTINLWFTRCFNWWANCCRKRNLAQRSFVMKKGQPLRFQW